MELLVVKDYDNSDSPGTCQYWLSGISSLDSSIGISSFIVPRDRNAALIGWAWYRGKEQDIEYVYLAEDLQQTSYYMDYSAKEKPPPRQIQKHGYHVHARCWTLIERFIAPEKAESSLKLLVEALRQQFQKQILEPPWFLDQDDFPVICPENDVPSIGLKAGIQYNYDSEIWYMMQSDETRYLSRDPVRIPEVECLLKGAYLSLPPVSVSEKKNKKKNKKKDKEMSKTYYYHPGPFSVVISRLALEIQYMI